MVLLNKEAYMDGFTPVTDVPTLQITDILEGTGEPVQAGATITAHYTGAVAGNGEVFQSSRDFGKPIQFGLNQVIKGWTDGVPGMKVGGIRRLARAYLQTRRWYSISNSSV
jgi:peptidylprolyl isomerase